MRRGDALAARLAVDGHADPCVVRLFAARQGIGEVVRQRSHAELVHGGQAIITRSQPDPVRTEQPLAASVQVQVQALHRRPGRKRIERGVQRTQIAPGCAPQMRQVEATEQPMPIGIVGLGLVQQRPPGPSGLAQRMHARRRLQHALVQPVGLRVARQEVAPDAAPQEGLAGLEAAGCTLARLQCFEPVRTVRRQRPGVHLDVGGAGQVGRSPRRMAGMEAVEAFGAHRGTRQHRLDKVLQPAPSVDPIMGLGPDAEFLEIVEMHGGAESLERLRFEPVQRLGRGRERKPVAQRLGNREDIQAHAAFLGGEMPVQAPRWLPGAQEMIVVDHHVAHAGTGQCRHHARFPDAFGEPGARRAQAEAALEAQVHRLELRGPVPLGDRGKHRLAVAGTEQLQLARRHHAGDGLDHVGVAFAQVAQQPARQMQRKPEGRIAGHGLEKRAIAAFDRFIDDAGEIADGLVRMHPEQQSQWCGVGHRVRWFQESGPARRMAPPDSGRPAPRPSGNSSSDGTDWPISA